MLCEICVQVEYIAINFLNNLCVTLLCHVDVAVKNEIKI